ncbi:MAG: class I SAM-dependent methyltransferase, partial [Lentimicrobium sp.]|nr:class I SAM-dependent methyltransferase [Lentimicrobium sp.]
MFDEVPRRYDLMNRLLTFRMDEVWRKKAAKICMKDNPSHIVDICTGTGDLACHLAGDHVADIDLGDFTIDDNFHSLGPHLDRVAAEIGADPVDHAVV